MSQIASSASVKMVLKLFRGLFPPTPSLAPFLCVDTFRQGEHEDLSRSKGEGWRCHLLDGLPIPIRVPYHALDRTRTGTGAGNGWWTRWVKTGNQAGNQGMTRMNMRGVAVEEPWSME